MAYSITNPPRMLLQSVGGVSPGIWVLTGTDTAATVDTTGYITNGGDLGMKVNDLVFYIATDTNIWSALTVITVSSTAPGAVDLSNATTLATGTTSD